METRVPRRNPMRSKTFNTAPGSSAQTSPPVSGLISVSMLCLMLGVSMLCMNLMGCAVSAPPASYEATQGSGESVVDILGSPMGIGKADGPTLSSLPAGFPQEQDLAILVPMDAEPPLRGNLSTNDGGVLLSSGWIDQVSEAYLDTDVEDALDTENYYEEWQVVSMRVAPCGPLGHYPGHIPDGACWPQVRVVWEPVVEDHMLFGFTRVDRYADDRAIHALYRVNPSPDAAGISPALQAVLNQVEAGAPLADMDRDTLDEFVRQRNFAMMRLTADVAKLREQGAETEGWYGVDIRAEYEMAGEVPFQFQDRLREFLAAYALPSALHELTSFSLPEGRSPAGIDSWVFIAFDGHDGRIVQKDITVRSREDGKLLVNVGKDQTVADNTEDDAVVEALNDPRVAEELKQHVFFENADAEVFGDVIADPTQTFVSNTTCATCHRLTDLTFDFHTFSYFEDRDATISPRVIEDVDNDLRVLRAFLATWPE